MHLLFKMKPTSSILFLDFFFNYYPAFVIIYRKFTIKVKCIIGRTRFLKQCLDEKVIPRLLNWIIKYDNEAPFPIEANKQLQIAIWKVKEDVEEQYFKLRKIKREFQSQIYDRFLWQQIQNQVNKVVENTENPH